MFNLLQFWKMTFAGDYWSFASLAPDVCMARKNEILLYTCRQTTVQYAVLAIKQTLSGVVSGGGRLISLLLRV